MAPGYTFIGRVIPELHNISMSPIEFRSTMDDRGNEVDLFGNISIAQSLVAARCVASREIADLVTAKHVVRRLSLSLVSAIGFSYGLGVDVQIYSEVEHSRPPAVFGVDFPAAASEKDQAEVIRYFSAMSLPGSQCLHLALVDYARAIREPEDTLMLCQRAIESIANDFGDKKKSRWNAMRSALKISKPYLQALSDRARGPRHGRLLAITEAERAAALRTAKTVIERYVSYIERGRRDLDIESYQEVIGQEFS